MKCKKCQTEIEDIAKFCPSCGNKVESPAPAEEETVQFSSERNRSDGIRGSQQSARIRTFYNKAEYAKDTVKVIERFLKDNDMETQIIENGEEIIIQGKRRQNILRTVLGLDMAVTIGLTVEGNDIRTTIGGAKWFDKAAGAVIGIYLIAPLLTAGWGVYKQQQLFTQVEREIDSFLSSR